MKSRPFWKMTGSGNDFVFFDTRAESASELESSAAIGALCERRTGIGADGIVLLERDAQWAFGIRYFNRDGSLAELCGNASLCAVTLAAELGITAPDTDFTFQTSSGPLVGRRLAGVSEFDVPLVAGTQPRFPADLVAGEQRIGFARVGVPHLVVLATNADEVDVQGRGRDLRNHLALTDGANANFVSPAKTGTWRMRTYERGVEEETLACGSGAVACARLLREWGLADGDVTDIRTSSGRTLTVTFRRGTDGQLVPSLRGEGRLVYSGDTRDLTW